MESSSAPPPKRREKPGGEYVKRPLNAFMVWSRVRRAKLREEMPDLRNTEISRRLGAEWREMSAEQKLPHIQRSRQLRIEHFDMYPNYRYRPKRKLKSGPVTGPRPVADILQASRSREPQRSSVGLGYRPVPPVHPSPPGPPNACVSRVSGVPVPSALFCNFPYGYTRPSQQVEPETVTSLAASSRQRLAPRPAVTPMFLTSVSHSPPECSVAAPPHHSLPPLTSLIHRSTAGNKTPGGSPPHASAPSGPVLKCHPLQPVVSSERSPSAQLVCTETDEDSDTESCSSPEEQGGSCHDNRLQNLRSCTGLFWATPLAAGGGHAKEKVIVESVPAIEPVSIAEPRGSPHIGSHFRFEWN
ncbi:hypothetical protein Bbelb_424670 [Branchiostoma belcheri]|nr:hypothetical protein Bbelb_424670 [Branchiostoma belcheri]